MDAAHNSVMTDEQAKACWAASACAVCARPKHPGYAFCPTCTAALPIWNRNWVAQGPTSSHWCDNFRSAHRHLMLNRRRERLFAPRGGWPYTSMDELAAAGYRFIEHSHCRVPGCGGEVMWYWTPLDGRIAIDRESCQPHRDLCADPEYFARQKAEQASAPRKRSKRRA